MNQKRLRYEDIVGDLMLDDAGVRKNIAEINHSKAVDAGGYGGKPVNTFTQAAQIPSPVQPGANVYPKPIGPYKQFEHMFKPSETPQERFVSANDFVDAGVAGPNVPVPDQVYQRPGVAPPITDAPKPNADTSGKRRSRWGMIGQGLAGAGSGFVRGGILGGILGGLMGARGKKGRPGGQKSVGNPTIDTAAEKAVE